MSPYEITDPKIKNIYEVYIEKVHHLSAEQKKLVQQLGFSYLSIAVVTLVCAVQLDGSRSRRLNTCAM